LRLSTHYPLFIVSSGGTKNILDNLKNNDLTGTFKEVLGLESHKSKVDKFHYLFDKYKLDLADCIFITDTLGDILEANAVNIKTIAVDFGYHGKETLAKGNPYKIVSSVDELLNAISQWDL
jgi:phosphoglycolate phosphatase-like HAD superfamily hydrolase